MVTDVDYCAVSCIQMWAWYDGNVSVTQNDIVNRVGNAPLYPNQVLLGVRVFTRSIGYLCEHYANEYYQDEELSMSVAAALDGRPSIIPVKNGTHAIISIGYKFHFDSEGRPIADYIYYHDPAYGPGYSLGAATFKAFEFTPANGWYRIILDNYYYVGQGRSGYQEFLSRGGTYYGGPRDYRPVL